MRTQEEVQFDLNNFEGKKSSKEYKELKKELNDVKSLENASEEVIGLGDVVEAITEATGIKKVVEVVSEATGIDCGCEERKKAWNEINLDTIKKFFRGKRVVNEINERDYKFLCDFFSNGIPSSVSAKDQKRIHNIYKSVFNIIKSPTNCAPCLRSTVKELYDVYQLNSK